MKIYHGSIEIVEKPEIREANRSLDYGSGFYATTSYEQALSWVKRRANEKKLSKGYINIYEFNEDSINNFKHLIFESATEEWLDFVMQNRIHDSFEHDYDIIYGPVANDKVYASFALFEGGFINKQALISELKTYKLVDQYLFHTEESLKTLKFIEAKEVIL
ncbi:MAG: DUF3990 domain-containing protein [Bacteroidales bacterium]|nr:DUF3990 domain-containing protein [Bacteroidales bacterium]